MESPIWNSLLALSADPKCDRLLGMWLGHAIGDAIGFPVEFRPGQISGVLDRAPLLRSQFQPDRTGVIGQVSDDTTMTITAVDCLVRNGGFQRPQMITAYETFANSISTLGRNTRELFKGVKTIAGYQTRWDRKFQAALRTGNRARPGDPTGGFPEITQSNGSLMRASAYVALSEEALDADCMLTNPHPHNFECGRWYIALLKAILIGQTPEQALHFAAQRMSIPFLRDILATDVRTVEDYGRTLGIPNPQTQRGWVVHAWGLARMAVRAERLAEFHRTLLNAYPRSDTDTVAAISGAVIGARLGISGLLQEEDSRRNLFTLLHSDTNQGQIPHPEWLHPRRYLQLAPEYVRLFWQ